MYDTGCTYCALGIQVLGRVKKSGRFSPDPSSMYSIARSVQRVIRHPSVGEPEDKLDF